MRCIVSIMVSYIVDVIWLQQYYRKYGHHTGVHHPLNQILVQYTPCVDVNPL